MKVLWITNILFPEVEQILTGSGELKSTGRLDAWYGKCFDKLW